MTDVSTAELSCGQALIHLLQAYGVDTVFGLPSICTLEFYRGLAASRIRHIAPRHQQGAGFMADGYARVSARPGVCLFGMGPGLTNAATPIAQADLDGTPMLILSPARARSRSGPEPKILHDVLPQRASSRSSCALTHTVTTPDEIPDAVARAFALFHRGRPRPVHIEIPLDILTAPARFAIRTFGLPPPVPPDAQAIDEAADLAGTAVRPLLVAGRGAIDAGPQTIRLAETLGAAMLVTVAAKGLIPDDHPLYAGSAVDIPCLQRFVATADLVIAVGTEFVETDFEGCGQRIRGRVIRIDLDDELPLRASKDEIVIVADVAMALDALGDRLTGHKVRASQGLRTEISVLRAATDSEIIPDDRHRRHIAVLEAVRRVLPDDGILMTDMAQVARTGNALFRTDRPRTYHYPGRYGAPGFALPAAIGARFAAPTQAVVALAGDGGLMVSIQELMTAVELGLPIAVVVWNNDGHGHVRDEMLRRGVPEIGVNRRNPDHLALARSMGCHAVRPESMEDLTAALEEALEGPTPTLIEIPEYADYLG